MNKTLIADSGSTKTHWVFANSQNEKEDYYSSGINPYFMNNAQIIELVNEIFSYTDKQEISNVYFYGAGCESDDKCGIVRDSLQLCFPNANIFVAEDLLASARALFGNGKGVACILGTGSNAAVFDGNDFTSKIDSLGYLLGDEGSGAYIGKQLLMDYYRKIMPLELRQSFQKEFNIKLGDVLDRVYKQESPNRYVASFAVFVSKHSDNEYIKAVTINAIDDFIKYQLGVIEFDKEKYELGFIGSISYYLKDILEQRLSLSGYKIAKIIKAPINDLVNYHLEFST